MSEGKLLSLDDMLSAEDIQYVEVPTPEWGGKVRLGSLSAGEMMTFIETSEGPERQTSGLRLIVRSLVDADGNRIGSDKYLESFKKKDAKVINRLVKAILELNGMDVKAQAAEKNDSGGTASVVSPSV